MERRPRRSRPPRTRAASILRQPLCTSVLTTPAAGRANCLRTQQGSWPVSSLSCRATDEGQRLLLRTSRRKGFHTAPIILHGNFAVLIRANRQLTHNAVPGGVVGEMEIFSPTITRVD